VCTGFWGLLKGVIFVSWELVGVVIYFFCEGVIARRIGTRARTTMSCKVIRSLVFFVGVDICRGLYFLCKNDREFMCASL